MYEEGLTLVKAPSRVVTYREMQPNLPLPPQPVITRWGTWLEAASFYCQNFNAVKEVINSLPEEDAQCIGESQAMFSKPTVQRDLAYIHTHFSKLVSAITSLEDTRKPLLTSLAVMDEVCKVIESAPGAIGKKIGEKLEAVLTKNPGLKVVKAISRVIGGDPPEDKDDIQLSPIEIANFSFAPLTSADVERSFSIFKNILTKNRQRLTPSNLEMLIVCNCVTKSFA